MKIIQTPQAMQRVLQKHRRGNHRIGLVPTMGALHDGHSSLIRRARKENECVVASIFVNPAQFGPKEDYLRYPRPLERDTQLCRALGVDYLFVPSVAAMYPNGYSTYITVEGLSSLWCGAFRPGHFRGVATVVAKFFNIVQPDRAYFGTKDYQQVAVLRQMAADLNMPVTIVSCPTVREKNGLARSSRNQYLSVDEKDKSTLIYQSLIEAEKGIKAKRLRSPAAVINLVRARIKKLPKARIDYVAVVDPLTIKSLAALQSRMVILAAVWVGKTRLIDNREINLRSTHVH